MHAIHAPRIQLDPSRIASISGAIAVNMGLLLLLIAPMSVPIMRAAHDDPPVVFITPKPQPVPPVPKDKPIKVDVTRPRPEPVPRPQRVERHETQPQQIVADTQPGDTKASDDPQPDAVTRPTMPADDGKPLAGAHLEYAENPAPAYPRDALASNETGTVVLEVLVDVDGRPISVTIARSSGSRSLDVAAKRQVLAKWRFRPAMRNGTAVQAIGLVPVDFQLN